jgi:hypothetical protein
MLKRQAPSAYIFLKRTVLLTQSLCQVGDHWGMVHEYFKFVVGFQFYLTILAIIPLVEEKIIHFQNNGA